MVATLKVNRIETVNDTGTITIPAGVKLVGEDAGSVYSPGSVIQCVHSTLTSTISYATGSGEDNVTSTGLTCTITPKSTSSIMVIQFNAFMGVSSYHVKLLLGRTIGGGANTYIGRGDAEGSRPRSTASMIMYDDNATTQQYLLNPISNTIKDTPSTISQIIYTLYFGGYNGITAYINRSHIWQNSPSNGYDAVPSTNMIVWEIAQ